MGRNVWTRCRNADIIISEKKISRGEKMKRKLLFVTEALWIGGIETALMNLLNRLDQRKYALTCLVLRGELDLKGRLPEGCRLLVADREEKGSFSTSYDFAWLYHLTEVPKAPSRRHKALMWAVPVLRWMENRLYIRYVRENLKQEQFDTCIIYSDRAAETAVRAVMADRFLLFYHRAAMETAWHDEIAYRRAEKIIAVSRKSAEQLRKYRSKYRDKVVAVQNLTETETVRCLAAENRVLPDEGFHLVTCGRLAEQKGIDWAIRACRNLVAEGYEDIHWWILGEGPLRDALTVQIKEAGIGDHFHLLGAKENPYPYVAAANLYVQPSRAENYSVAVLEAKALCRPILATIPAAEEQIRSGENGLLCEPDPEAIARGIRYLYTHREEMAKFVRALENDDPEAENRQIMDSLCRLFDGENG